MKRPVFVPTSIDSLMALLVLLCSVAYRGGLGVQTPPPGNSEVLTKSNRIEN